MKLPYKWIKEYADISADAKTYAHKMTMSGSKIEGYECFGDSMIGVVMCRVESIVQHPNADKLVVFHINLGKEDNIQICPVATNLKTGSLTPVSHYASTLLR